MKIYSVKKLKKKPKSHAGKMEGAYNPPNWSGKLDTRLTPVHRYTLQETNFPIIETKSQEAKNDWTKDIDNKRGPISHIFKNILEYIIDEYPYGNFNIAEVNRRVRNTEFGDERITNKTPMPQDPLKKLFDWGYLEISKNNPSMGKITDKGLYS